MSGNEYKPLLLKVLGDHLFLDPTDRSSFSKDNTLLIDDSPQKSVLNENRNAIFLESWDRSQRGDNFLMGSLAPWLKHLHEDCQLGPLKEFVEANRIGSPPVSPFSNGVEHLLDGLRKSAGNFRSRFILPGMGLVIEPERRSNI